MFLKLVQAVSQKIESDEQLTNQKPAGWRTTKQNSKKTSPQRLKETPLEISSLERCKRRWSKHFWKFDSIHCAMQEFKQSLNTR